ncbi:hypothetical protein B0H12DRAFT_1078488 [Mycena haematopus]|nr:hypothetical protein B0H12DRAFT_1078488 [Mycena haematopus]
MAVERHSSRQAVKVIGDTGCELNSFYQLLKIPLRDAPRLLTFKTALQKTSIVSDGQFDEAPSESKNKLIRASPFAGKEREALERFQIDRLIGKTLDARSYIASIGADMGTAKVRGVPQSQRWHSKKDKRNPMDKCCRYKMIEPQGQFRGAPQVRRNVLRCDQCDAVDQRSFPKPRGNFYSKHLSSHEDEAIAARSEVVPTLDLRAQGNGHHGRGEGYERLAAGGTQSSLRPGGELDRQNIG